MTRKEKIQYIKSFSEPPFLNDDIYWHRYPWPLFGGVSSGICMCWCWYREDIIEKASDEDVEAAYKEMMALGRREHGGVCL